jgi:polar amino acid transport system substrate-binding protein
VVLTRVRHVRNRSPAALLATLAAAALLSACAAQAARSPDPIATQPADRTPSASVSPVVGSVPAGELLFRDKLLICSDLPYPPQEFFDPAGEPIGSDIEIGQEIARRLGLEPEIVNSLFDTIIDAALNDKCDIIISAQSITAEREALVTMIPYFKAGQTFLVPAGNPGDLGNELDLCGARVATQSGSIHSQLVSGTGDYEGVGLSPACVAAGLPAIELDEFEKDDQAIAALIDGEVDTYFLDSPAAGYHVLQQPDELALMGLTLDVAVQGISVPPDKTGLSEAIRVALDSMIADGTYKAILDEYGVGDGSIADG